MSSITELESALSDVFASFEESTVIAADTVRVDVAQADVREIRTDLTILAGSRPSGN
jgi:hypothetical protein